jgi:hypothetical protein
MKINKNVITVIQILIVVYILAYFKSGGQLGLNKLFEFTPSSLPNVSIEPTYPYEPSPTTPPLSITPQGVNGGAVDSDPILNCKIGQSCATMRIRRSQCLTYQVCCTVGNDHIPMKSVDDCNRAVSEYEQKSNATDNETSTNSYVFPTYVFPTRKPFSTLAPLPTFPPLPTFGPFPTFAPFSTGQSPEQCRGDVMSGGYEDSAIESRCKSLYTDSTTVEMCVSSRKQLRDMLLASCGQ